MDVAVSGSLPNAEESGYVEILGGEEPPDEWLNLGMRRERISSSSSDGSEFQYISAGQGHPYSQEDANWAPIGTNGQVGSVYIMQVI